MYRYQLPFIKAYRTFKNWLRVEITRLTIKDKGDQVMIPVKYINRYYVMTLYRGKYIFIDMTDIPL